MVIVAGFLTVEPSERESYLAGCVEVVEKAREADGCLDYSISADLVEPSRINVFERWESTAAVEAFRGDGPSGDQGARILDGSVSEFEVGGERSLFG